MTHSDAQGGYLSRTWRAMTQDKGWIKPVLLLSLAMVVPVVGPLAVMGYVADWARLLVWGADGAPKQTGVRIGECIKTGWRVFVVALCWNLVFLVAFFLLDALIGLFLWGDAYVVFHMVLLVAVWFGDMVAQVGCLRAVIYEKISPGLDVHHVCALVGADVGGIVRVWGIWLLGLLLDGVVSVLGVLLVVLSAVGPLVAFTAEAYGAMGSYEPYMLPYAAEGMFSAVFGAVFPAAVVLGFILTMVSVVFSFLTTGALGLWLSQFDVASWGNPKEMPFLPATTTPDPGPVAPQGVPMARPTTPPATPVTSQTSASYGASAASPTPTVIDGNLSPERPPVPGEQDDEDDSLWEGALETPLTGDPDVD